MSIDSMLQSSLNMNGIVKDAIKNHKLSIK